VSVISNSFHILKAPRTLHPGRNHVFCGPGGKMFTTEDARWSIGSLPLATLTEHMTGCAIKTKKQQQQQHTSKDHRKITMAWNM